MATYYSSYWTGYSSGTSGTTRKFRSMVGCTITSNPTQFIFTINGCKIQKKTSGSCTGSNPMWAEVRFSIAGLGDIIVKAQSTASWSLASSANATLALNTLTYTMGAALSELGCSVEISGSTARVIVPRVKESRTVAIGSRSGKTSGAWSGTTPWTQHATQSIMLLFYRINYYVNGVLKKYVSFFEDELPKTIISDTWTTKNHHFVRWEDADGNTYAAGDIYDQFKTLNLYAVLEWNDGWLEGELWLKTEDGWVRGVESYKKIEGGWRRIVPFVNVRW